MSELRIGIVGLGQMGGYHLRNFDEIAGARVVAVAEPDAALATARIAHRPIAHYTDHRTMLESEALDAVCVCAPSAQHAEVGLDVIDAGVAVLIEKPIATTLEDGLRLTARARRAGVKLVVGHVERYNPAVQLMSQLIADGRIGRVYRAHATRVGPLPPRIQDTGVAIDLATHDLDIMQVVLGRDITRVYAEGARWAHPSQEDMITCLMRFGEGGPQGLLDVNWLTPEKRREMTVVGEGGMIRAAYLTQDVWLTEAPTADGSWAELARLRGDAESRETRLALRRVEPLRAELEAFVACVRDDLPEPVSGADGCRALAAALAVRESAHKSRPVALLDTAVALPQTAAA